MPKPTIGINIPSSNLWQADSRVDERDMRVDGFEGGFGIIGTKLRIG